MTTLILKKTTLLFSLLCAVLIFQSCDSFCVKSTGDDLTLNFDETNFHGLDLCVPANVEVRVDSVFKVEITGEESAMPYLRTEVNNGILQIRFSRNVYDVDHMKIVVSAPAWHFFEVSGSGKVQVLDAISGNELRMEVSGSGEIKAVDADFNNAKLEVSGSGNLELSGIADELRAEISGSGDVNCLDFPVKTAQLEVSGSGRMKVHVSEALDAEITGSGDIDYTGNPQVTVEITGSGKLRKI